MKIMDIARGTPLLGSLSPAAFMRRHWQKKPLLARGAIADPLPGFDRRRLFALAARDEVESRLVVRRGEQWSLRPGPIARRALPPLSAPGWSLLVQGVDLHDDAAHRLLQRFRFVPDARLDDVMVSFASDGGGVGPHIDSYDVFLLQIAGQRRWRIGRVARPRLRDDVPLKMLAGFRATEEWLLDPGDLLYLPPGWGHDGVALDECFTCSIGFRAPRGAELGAAFLDYLHERGLPQAEYRDPNLSPTKRGAQIDARMVDFADALLRKIRWRRTDVEDFLGRFLTTPKPEVVFSPSRGKKNRLVELHPKSQLLYRGVKFFLNGESFTVPARQARVLKELADRRQAPRKALARAGLGRLLSDWRKSGYLR